jgi:hypothetical protein
MAFRQKGHDAYSCDIVDCSGGHPEWHIRDDVLLHLDDGWDLMIGHPPCTFLSYVGNRHWDDCGRMEKRLDALSFFGKLWRAPINRICLENPMGCASPVISKYSQIINPNYFGDGDKKRTCLWLKGLPKLNHLKGDDLFGVNTHVDVAANVTRSGRKVFFTEKISGSVKRSKSFTGIAKAMADQWG